MILTMFITFAWLISMYFLIQSKQLSLVDYFILWFANSVAIVSITTIISLNLGWLHFSEDKELFLTHLVKRSFIDPMLLLISANLVIKASKKYYRLLNAIAFLILFLILEYCMVRLHVVTFIKFNYFYIAVMYSVILAFSHLVVFLLHRGGSHENYSI